MALPAVALTAAAVAGVAQVAAAQVACVDAARAGARAAARGDTDARVVEVARSTAAELGRGDAARVAIDRGAAVAVSVRRRVRLLMLPHGPRVTVSARAVAEPEQAHDTGSATVLLTAVVAVAAALALAIAMLSGVVVARHRAHAAADLAALAAAGAVSSGAPTGRACRVADRVATANGARLLSCRAGARADEVDVVVSVRPPGATGRLGVARSRSRAGQGWR